MNEREMNQKKENDVLKNNEESFVIPNEAACSQEFQEGCVIMEDEAEKHFGEK